MIDTWITTADKPALDELLFEETTEGIIWNYRNVIGPVESQGIWYACIRSGEDIVLPEEIVEITEEEASSVLGVWA